MIGSGFAAVIVFSRQEGRFFRGLAMGIANLLTTFLSGISAFSDIISYIRLFAVGLAGIEISKSFNGIAAGFGSGPLGIAAGLLILLLGHSLNMAMGALSVVVHGVRLNMLEFSGHLGMEWSGKPYKPFKE
jgi:V/A-type H+-transporting ATPase subunit I